MRFFNLDLHIGVIGDISNILCSMGHEVVSWSISGHTWIFDRQPDVVDVVNQDTWKRLDQSMCDAFYERYASELESFDAFIVTHTPSFAMLYERWKKPIICVASTRYEHPFSNNRAAWETFNDFLREKIDSGLLIPLANNKYDAAYTEYFTKRTWSIIPSLCEYTNASYTGTRKESLYDSKFSKIPKIDNLISKNKTYGWSLRQRLLGRLGFASSKFGYKWSDLYAFRSVVIIPYNASTMSIFEMYTAGVPMLFPTLRFAMELYPANKLKGVFSEVSYNQVLHLPGGSIIPCDERDPNRYEDCGVMEQWFAKSDFYDPENMAGLEYFDSFNELRQKLKTIDPVLMHTRMSQHNVGRKKKIYGLWEDVVRDLEKRIQRGL